MYKREDSHVKDGRLPLLPRVGCGSDLAAVES